jgi:hypothetical protein
MTRDEGLYNVSSHVVCDHGQFFFQKKKNISPRCTHCRDTVFSSFYQGIMAANSAMYVELQRSFPFSLFDILVNQLIK